MDTPCWGGGGSQEVVVVQMSDHLLPEDPLIYFDYMRRKGDRSVV